MHISDKLKATGMSKAAVFIEILLFFRCLNYKIYREKRHTLIAAKQIYGNSQTITAQVTYFL